MTFNDQCTSHTGIMMYHHDLQNDVHHSVLCNDAIICSDFLENWYNDNLYKFVLLSSSLALM
jgi:hypothetical protein